MSTYARFTMEDLGHTKHTVHHGRSGTHERYIMGNLHTSEIQILEDVNAYARLTMEDVGHTKTTPWKIWNT